jgi:mono/diheme cytochrome c family protein
MKARFSCVFAVRIALLTGFVLAITTRVCAEETSDFQRKINAANPVAHWSFSELDVTAEGAGLTAGPRGPVHSGFSVENTGGALKGGAHLVIPDEGMKSRFDFDHGDSFSVEAMVNPTELKGYSAILTKGRTSNAGFPSDNQNWAFRLASVGGKAGVNFLFRSRAGDHGPADWHRWTSKDGFAVGSGWHHIALSYTFGNAESIRAYIDGNEVEGQWDMGGATTAPPVVDDDEVWLGSTMGGNISNSFHGALDEVALYRRVVPETIFKSRFEYVPPPLVLPDPNPGVLQVNMHGPLSSDGSFPNDPGEPLAAWQQAELGFLRLPLKYDDWGIREDWGTAVMVRAVTEIELEPGDYEFLLRSRTATRLFIDREQVVSLPKQKRGGGAHNQVMPIPDVVRPGMRPAAMDDVEKVVSFSSSGGRHAIVMDVMVGGPRLRLDFGEPCLAISNGTDMFRLLTAGQQKGSPLTDEGWLGFVDRLGQQLDAMDVEHRRQADLQQAYWNGRHQYAAERLAGESTGKSIDQLVDQRITTAKQNAGDPDSFFNKHVRPIFAEHCYRCHGDKERGELNLHSQENVFAGGESGDAAVAPGKPQASYLMELVTSDAGDRMPPKGAGLNDKQIDTLRKWIVEGGRVDSTPVEIAEVHPVVDDLTFLRRAWLDLVGVSPPVNVVRQFLQDGDHDKRALMIDRLLMDERWADNWVGYWQDVLAENPNLLKPMLNNTGPFRYWILESLRDNKPMDRFATELITMRGSTWGGGAGGFSVATLNDVPMAAKAHIIGTAFLGVNMKCARCHDAPYHETTQETLFQLAAMLKRKPIKVPATSSVPIAFFEHVDAGGRESLIDVTLDIGSTVNPEWPFEVVSDEDMSRIISSDEDSRVRFAANVTFSRRFAEVIVNRLWKRLMGAGLVEPVDDWEGHQPADPALLAFMTDEFIRGGYDLRLLTSQIMNSKLYQRAAQDVPANLVESDRFFEGPYRRRLAAEQIVDNAWHAAGREMNLGHLTMDIEGRLAPDYFMNFGQPKHAWELTTMANERDRPSLAMPKMQAVVDTLLAFGWRNSRQEPTSHRVEEPNPLQPGVLANGVMGSWLTQLTDDSELTRVCMDAESVDELVETLFLRFLTRLPTPSEEKRFIDLLSSGFADRVVPEQLLPPPVKLERMPYVSWSNHLDGAANSIKQKQEEIARQGDPPTRYLRVSWRERAEDALWALLNAPEMIIVP